MTQDEIIEMAVQAGMAEEIAAFNIPIIEAFANLVAAKEREACAKVCENSAGIIDAPSAFINGPSNSATRKAQCFADAIRARTGDKA